ncbi:hypothetical protein [Streptomyces lincolnensis]|uniref:hypothetical protein n=1 Tax=Streptomyces lincolnensis TaxID=1915 RepID=UPI0037CFC042
MPGNRERPLLTFRRAAVTVVALLLVSLTACSSEGDSARTPPSARATTTPPAAPKTSPTVAVTEMGIATHIGEIAAHMGRLPGAEDDVDAAAMAALRAAPDDWGGLVDENLRQVDLAARASTRGTFLSGATALAVVSEMPAGRAVAALARGAGRRWVLWAAAGTAGSAALAFAALL